MKAKVLIKRILAVVIATFIFGIFGASAQAAPQDNTQTNVSQSVQNNTHIFPYRIYDWKMMNGYAFRQGLLPCFCGCPCCSNSYAMYLWLSFEVIHKE